MNDLMKNKQNSEFSHFSVLQTVVNTEEKKRKKVHNCKQNQIWDLETDKQEINTLSFIYLCAEFSNKWKQQIE
jgi:hypothetical protein